MSLELVELEYLVLNHDDCKVKDCPTCERIDELRNKMGDTKEPKYILKNMITGREKQYKTLKDVARAFGRSQTLVQKMLTTGDERYNHTIRRVKKDVMRYTVINEFGKPKTFTNLYKLVDSITISLAKVNEIMDTGISYRGYLIYSEVVNA